jgi:hypothetical protein
MTSNDRDMILGFLTTILYAGAAGALVAIVFAIVMATAGE